jgi:hypothetical protein
LITSPKTTVKYFIAVRTCSLIFNSYSDILFPHNECMNGFLTHWLIFLFPYFCIRLSAVEKVSSAMPLKKNYGDFYFGW